jgi:anti-sigma B factor antagonist
LSNIGIKQQRVGDVTVLHTDGKLRIGLKFGGSGVPLTNAIDSLLEEGQNRILLNLEGVTSIDAKGMGELVSNYVAVKKQGGQFKLSNLTQMLRELMITTKLLTVFDVYENEAQAIDGFTNYGFASAPETAVPSLSTNTGSE